MVHIIKVYFKGVNNETQIRRLAVNSDIVTKFQLLSLKIKEIFPALIQGPFEVTWKDSENDVIHMSSDEELAQALANAEDGLLRIYVFSSVQQPSRNEGNSNLMSNHSERHPNVICDNCDHTICGYRYKCLQCRNYDLCSACNAANIHDSHDMIKLVRPTYIPREWVFLGARKLWRNLFGRCPPTYHTACINQTEQTSKPDSQWPSAINDLLKGDYVSAEKLIKENLGSFLNFCDSVAGGVELKLESIPSDSSPPPSEKLEKEEKANDVSSKTESTPIFSPSQPEEVVQTDTKNVELVEAKATAQTKAEDFDYNVVREKFKELRESGDENSYSEYQRRFINQLVQSSRKASLEKNKKASLEKNKSSNPQGLFCDNDSSDDWTILNDQDESEKKEDVATTDNTGAKPKHPNIYPILNESVQSNKILQPGAETKPKEQINTQAVSPPVDQTRVSEPCPQLQESLNISALQAPEILNALTKMQQMGFTNEGGWLERLLITKDGNINSALDSLYPNTRRQ